MKGQETGQDSGKGEGGPRDPERQGRKPSRAGPWRWPAHLAGRQRGPRPSGMQASPRMVDSSLGCSHPPPSLPHRGCPSQRSHGRWGVALFYKKRAVTPESLLGDTFAGSNEQENKGNARRFLDAWKVPLSHSSQLHGSFHQGKAVFSVSITPFTRLTVPYKQ